MLTNEEKIKKVLSEISYADIFPDGKFDVDVLWRIVNEERVFKGFYLSQRDVFYVGFTECFRVLTDFAGDLPEEKACGLFSLIAKQLKKFSDDLHKRIAGNE